MVLRGLKVSMCNIQVGCQRQLKYMHVRTWASCLFSTFFFLNFSFSPHPAEVEAEGGW